MAAVTIGLRLWIEALGASKGDAVNTKEKLLEKYKLKLWCDLKSDQERYEFLKSGRATGSGVICHSIEAGLVRMLEQVPGIVKVGEGTKLISDWTSTSVQQVGEDGEELTHG